MSHEASSNRIEYEDMVRRHAYERALAYYRSPKSIHSKAADSEEWTKRLAEMNWCFFKDEAGIEKCSNP